MDPRLHRVQGKAERVTELLPLLQEFHRDKLEPLLRHQAGARLIRQYDANNTYQYIVNRDEVQLLGLVLGETLKQKRFFEQELAGRTDLLGRRGASLGPSHGEVLPSRWIE